MVMVLEERCCGDGMTGRTTMTIAVCSLRHTRVRGLLILLLKAIYYSKNVFLESVSPMMNSP